VTQIFSESGSYRDRSGQVFYQDGEVYRGISQQSLDDWLHFQNSNCAAILMSQLVIISTTRVTDDSSVPAEVFAVWAGVLHHERVPFISYPYEWPFGMLKDAALQQLRLILELLDEGMILKDASSFNSQWFGTKPVFIDTPSIQRLQDGEPWAGYNQFSAMFIAPLLLTAYKGVDFQQWLRGRLDGIPVDELARLMSTRDLLRTGVLKHVTLQAKLIERGRNSDTAIKQEVRSAGFSSEMIKANARGLRKLIEQLQWTPRIELPLEEYSGLESDSVVSFLQSIASSQRFGLIWDLNSRSGRFAIEAARSANYVIAMDSDHLAIEHLYQSLKTSGPDNILPLVNNVVDPSPALGWRLQERKSLPDRGKPDLTLCLALIHHVVIGANVPLDSFIEWIAELESDLVIEFVSRDDPMVQQLLRNKEDIYWDYNLDYFESCLDRLFQVNEKLELSSGTRTLYYARPRR
jgi:hypothetical protein